MVIRLLQFQFYFLLSQLQLAGRFTETALLIIYLVRKAILPYKWFFVLFVFIGAIAELEAVWSFGDAALGFMTFPNLIAIVLLSTSLKKMTKKYFSEEHTEYKKK